MEVKPEITQVKIIETNNICCPFCGNRMDFELRESMEDKGIKFRCSKCKKRYHITNL